MVVEVGRISVMLSDKLEKQLRFKTIERFGGKKGDLTRAVEEAIQTWVAKEEQGHENISKSRKVDNNEGKMQ